MNDSVTSLTKSVLVKLGSLNAPVLVREQVFDRLRDAIINGQLPPGTRLVERELCEAMGVSRTSIREVLRRLEAERLVNVEPRKGPFVSKITREQAEEIYYLRAYLEGLLVRLFVERASDREIAQLERIAEKFAAVAAKSDVAAAVKAKTDFYDHIARAARSEVLRDMVNQLAARASTLRAASMAEPGRLQASVAEILAIVAAVKRRDSEGAEEAAVFHVKSAAKTALARLT